MIKEYVEKWSREVAQAQVTVTPYDSVQHCSPCSPNSDMPSNVCFRVESSEGKMGPELKKLEPISAGTGPEKPGQQFPPNEETWQQVRTTASDILTAGVGSSQGGNISSSTERAKRTRITVDITFLQRRKQAGRLRWKRREGPALERGCNSTFFFWGELGGSLLVLRALYFVCALFPKLLGFFSGDHFSAS